MNTEINITMNTKKMTDTQKAKTADQTLKINSKKLVKLAAKARAAYAKEHKADGMVVDWRAKQLKAGIEMGECLNEAKAILPFKGFVKWCRVNFRKLTQRTLNRYMAVARNKALMSHAKGLRDAYKNCSTDKSASKSEGKSKTETDFGEIKQHLTEATRLLNGYPDLIAYEGADVVCEMVEALNVWSADYRERSERHKLNKQHDDEFEEAVADGHQPSTLEQNGEHVTTE